MGPIFDFNFTINFSNQLSACRIIVGRCERYSAGRGSFIQLHFFFFLGEIEGRQYKGSSGMNLKKKSLWVRVGRTSGRMIIKFNRLFGKLHSVRAALEWLLQPYLHGTALQLCRQRNTPIPGSVWINTGRPASSKSGTRGKSLSSLHIGSSRKMLPHHPRSPASKWLYYLGWETKHAHK